MVLAKPLWTDTVLFFVFDIFMCDGGGDVMGDDVR